MKTPNELTVQYMELFPTRVWTVDMSLLSGHVTQWVAAVERMRAQNPQPAGRSNRSGWNSAPTLFDDALFAPLEQAVRGVVDFAFAEMGPPTHSYQLQAWCNVHEQGSYNIIHNHAGSLLSACYYLQVPPGSGALMLRDPRPGALLSPWQGTLRPNSGGEVSIAPQPGQLLVFPSWLEHAAEAHAGDVPRISIPINVARA